jgi:serine/threonine protein kinase
MATRLLHTNIIRYLGMRMHATYRVVNRLDELCCITIIEFAPRGELTHLISSYGRLSEEAARTYFHMLIDAVAYMHSIGVYHLDIKPQNILLDGSFHIKLTDFGFSSQYATSRTLMGTEGYAAP